MIMLVVPNKAEEYTVGTLVPLVTPTPTPTPPDIHTMGMIARPSPTPKQTPKATPKTTSMPRGEYLVGDVIVSEKNKNS
jgi:hypothetical protein